MDKQHLQKRLAELHELEQRIILKLAEVRGAKSEIAQLLTAMEAQAATVRE